jgi:hypothetical protein
MFSVNNAEVKQYERDLKVFAANAFPYAARQTLNDVAFAAQKTAKLNARTSLVLRNKFTEQSIRVERATGLNIRQMYSVMGSVAPYMEDQEFGGVKRKRGKTGVAIPTSYSSGEGTYAQPRKRLPRKPNKLQSIRLKKRAGVNRKQKNLIAVKEAAASNNKYAYLSLGKTKGIFRVVGGKRNPKPMMVHDLSEQSVLIPKSPVIVPAAIAVKPKIHRIYLKNLKYQMKRNGLFVN